MSSVSVTRRVAADPARTFDVFTDLARAAERVSGIESLEMLSDGDVGVGTRWRETRTMFGKQATEEMEISAFDPPRSYEVVAESHGSRYLTDFRFEPSGDGTDVTMTFTAVPLSFGAKLLAPLGKLMLGKVAKECGKDLDDLAAAAEGG